MHPDVLTESGDDLSVAAAGLWIEALDQVDDVPVFVAAPADPESTDRVEVLIGDPRR